MNKMNKLVGHPGIIGFMKTCIIVLALSQTKSVYDLLIYLSYVSQGSPGRTFSIFCEDQENFPRTNADTQTYNSPGSGEKQNRQKFIFCCPNTQN